MFLKLAHREYCVQIQSIDGAKICDFTFAQLM